VTVGSHGWACGDACVAQESGWAWETSGLTAANVVRRSAAIRIFMSSAQFVSTIGSALSPKIWPFHERWIFLPLFGDNIAGGTRAIGATFGTIGKSNQRASLTGMSQASLALSNLRGIVIVIVLAFHSSLAYLASAPAQGARFDQAPYTWQAFPIIDTHRWIGFDLFCAWQDVSLMSSMFFLSGLFVAPGLLRKGCWPFVIDRIWRIGLPFVLVILFLSPLALYPAYSVRTVDPSFAGFWQQWTSLPFWPIGPEWFLCVLLVLSMIAAGLYAVVPGYIKQLGRLAAWACERPIKFWALLVTISLVAYVPLALAYSPWSWVLHGPFSLQLSRPAHYLTYFFAGMAVGQVGLDRGLLTRHGPLARHWWMWLGAAVVSFGAWAGLTSLTMPDWAAAPLAAQIAGTVAYPVACASGCLFLLAVCLRFSRTHILILDSLSANAYAMYLVHYVFVVWLQYALLGSNLFAIAKVAIVLGCTLILSWASSAAFNRFVLGAYFVPAKRAIAPARD